MASMHTGGLFRKATLADLPGILETERLCFGDDSFSERQFRYLVSRSNGSFFVREEEGRIAAYACLLFHTGTRNVRIYSIAVHPEFRNRKIGQAMMDAAMSFALGCGARKITLEVNVSNESAIRLYKKNGFTTCGLLPEYYHDGSSAFRMQRDLREHGEAWETIS